MPYQYEIPIKIKKDHLDELNHVNNVVYLQWAQDIAKKHWMSKAPESVQKNNKWVVIRHEINYRRPCYENDPVLVKTKVANDISGPKWGRHVHIFNGESIAAEVFSIWCQIDAQSGRPLRISKEIANVFN